MRLGDESAKNKSGKHKTTLIFLIAFASNVMKTIRYELKSLNTLVTLGYDYL